MSVNFTRTLISRRFSNCDEPSLALNARQRTARDAVLAKIESGHYKYETIVCPICRGTDFLTVSERDRYGLPTKTSVCTKCGLFLSNPRLDRDSMLDFYTNHYRAIYNPCRTSSVDQFTRSKEKGGAKIFDFVSKFRDGGVPFDGFVVDIGCGNGGILQYFRDKGCRCLGFEVDRKFGGDVAHLQDFEVIHEEFDPSHVMDPPDLVICHRILEHIGNVNGFLRGIAAVMGSRSILYVSVPSVTSFQHSTRSSKLDFLQYLHPAHVYHFSLTTLKNLIVSNGFEFVAGTEHSSIWKESGGGERPDIVSTYPRELEDLSRSQRALSLYLFRNIAAKKFRSWNFHARRTVYRYLNR